MVVVRAPLFSFYRFFFLTYMAKQSAAKQSDAAFQIGDRVKVIDGGALGTVHEINVHLTSGAVQYWVRFADGTDETFVCYDALSLQAID